MKFISIFNRLRLINDTGCFICLSLGKFKISIKPGSCLLQAVRSPQQIKLSYAVVSFLKTHCNNWFVLYVQLNRITTCDRNSLPNIRWSWRSDTYYMIDIILIFLSHSMLFLQGKWSSNPHVQYFQWILRLTFMYLILMGLPRHRQI